MLWAHYRTEPRAIARVLPRPLEPGAEAAGSVFVAHYPRTAFGSVYNESALFVRARCGEVEGNFCLSMSVDDDVALILGRELLGFPKKLATITLSRNGDSIAGSASRRGSEFLRIEATLTGPGERDDPFGGLPILNLKAFPAVGGGFEFPPRIVMLTARMTPSMAERGEGRICLGQSNLDPLHEIPVVDVTRIRYVEGDLGGADGGGKVLAEAQPEDIIPFLFARTF
jgi:acetoacetate decarboxylase